LILRRSQASRASDARSRDAKDSQSPVEAA